MMFKRLGKKNLNLRWNSKENRYRTAKEDALKHFFDCEYHNLIPSVQSLSGSLGINGGQATTLITKLESEHLVMPGRNGFILTPEGQKYALKIIRTHRLLECYLADKTGVDRVKWHALAEKLEHNMQHDELDELAASVGNPLFDPHGDPIPTRKGELPPLEELSLTNLEPGEHAEIVHLEDEPEEVFSRIVEYGLTPGQTLHVQKKTHDKITIKINGKSVSLTHVIAANVAVQRTQYTPATTDKFQTLANLKLGEYGRIVHISGLCRGMQRRRILDLGATPGTVVSMELNSAGGDPVGYGIRGAVIALRKDQAELIQIKRLEPPI